MRNIKKASTVKRRLKAVTGAFQRKVVAQLSGEDDKAFDLLFKKLVPMSGKADTVEGEFLRAYNKIAYRHYNDGDYFFKGYGTETAGPPMAFLLEEAHLTPANVREKIKNLAKATETFYEAKLDDLGKEIIAWLKDLPASDMRANSQYDMLSETYQDAAWDAWGEEEAERQRKEEEEERQKEEEEEEDEDDGIFL